MILGCILRLCITNFCLSFYDFIGEKQKLTNNEYYIPWIFGYPETNFKATEIKKRTSYFAYRNPESRAIRNVLHPIFNIATLKLLNK
jgi:hypothetical protein